jgi:hypothetical protein
MFFIPPKSEHTKAYPFGAFANQELNEIFNDVMDMTQAPAPLIGSAMMAVMASVTQAQVDVEGLTGEATPCSLIVAVVADKGERKTTVTKILMKKIEEETSHEA